MPDTFVTIQSLPVVTDLDDTETRIPLVEDADTSPVTKSISIGVLNRQSPQATPVATPADLRNVTQNFTRDGQKLHAISTREDFTYKADSVLADNGTTVFAPTWAGATGRWEIDVAASSSGGGAGGTPILQWNFDTSSNSTAGMVSGQMRSEDSASNSTSQLYIHEEDINGTNLSAYLDDVLAGSTSLAGDIKSLLTLTVGSETRNWVIQNWTKPSNIYIINAFQFAGASFNFTDDTATLSLPHHYAQTSPGDRFNLTIREDPATPPSISANEFIWYQTTDPTPTGFAVPSNAYWDDVNTNFTAQEFWLHLTFERGDHSGIYRLDSIASITGGYYFTSFASFIEDSVLDFANGDLFQGKVRAFVTRNTGGGGGGGSTTTGNRETLAGNKTLAIDGPKFEVLDPGAANRNVDLYAGGASFRYHIIVHDGASNNLVIRNESAVVLATLTASGQQASVMWDTNSWRLI